MGGPFARPIAQDVLIPSASVDGQKGMCRGIKYLQVFLVCACLHVFGSLSFVFSDWYVRVCQSLSCATRGTGERGEKGIARRWGKEPRKYIALMDSVL